MIGLEKDTEKYVEAFVPTQFGHECNAMEKIVQQDSFIYIVLQHF
jgi:hypothetical protein